MVFEAVINISEGRDLDWLASLVATTPAIVDLHTDAFHHRSVLTLIGDADGLLHDLLSIARDVIAHIDLTQHDGVHPRLGALDVVPFVPLGHATLEQAQHLRDHAATLLADELDLPCFLYGPQAGGDEITLPELRRRAFQDLTPDRGPLRPNPRSGAVAVGARPLLVAWNIWVEGLDLNTTKRLAVAARSAGVRTLGLQVGDATQISCNLIDPLVETPAMVLDRCIGPLEAAGGRVQRTELVGLAPSACLDQIATDRWAEVDLSAAMTIEAAANRRGIEIS